MHIPVSRWPLARLVMLLGMLVLLPVLLAGCDFPWQPKQSDMAKDQTLRMGWATGGGPDITTLDPAQCRDMSCRSLVAILYDGLVALDRNEHVEPWAAKGWTISPDGLTYTFALRPNMKFSDGNAVKPSDFAWSIDRSANPCLGSLVSYYLWDIKDARAFSAEPCTDQRGNQIKGSIKTLVGDSVIPDDSANTLTIKLARPSGYFLAALAYLASSAIEKSVVLGVGLGKDDTWLDHLATGTTGTGTSGMFYVSKWDHHGVLTLKPNPHWWGLHAGKKPHFTEVDFKLFASTDTEYITYQADQTLAFTDTIPVDQIAAAKGRSDYHQQPMLIIIGLKLNWKIAPFDDIDARKAFCLAINREQLNQQAFQGRYIPGWHMIPRGMDGYNPQVKGLDGAPVSGDVTLAKHYWQLYLAAHHNTVPRVSIRGAESNEGILATKFYQATWKQVFDVQLTTYYIRTIFEEGAARTRQLDRFGWEADYPDPQDFLSLLYTSDSPYNTQNASVPAADNLMRRADALSDMHQRIPLYNRAEQMLIDAVAVCPLYQMVNHYALRPWVKGGFVEDARGLIPNDAWVSGYIAKH
ncbi:MAG TPA: peptide ABC transporter substrate-binding protein [Ktedonobacterales bacterium]|nr:peptide ABC transporter substrate-binding protein [Ktedonobacterales bacterium]